MAISAAALAMTDQLRVLVVDDEPAVRGVLKEGLGSKGHRVTSAGSGAVALQLLRERAFDVVLLDLKMPGMDGLAVLEALRRNRVDAAVAILTAHGDVESAVAAMKLGARDYLRKPFEFDDLDRVVRHLAEGRSVRSASPRPTPAAPGAQPPVLVGIDAKIVALRTTVERIAPTDVTVLITGESGTGKELVARLIHMQSGRARGPLVAVDCPAIPVALFESELFGHERGAFTGAVARKRGTVEEAEGGTLFLDEMAELPLEVQPKLLRFLQERQVTRVGGTMAVRVDTRVISATNLDLAAMVEQGTFRRDLFHRLNVVRIDLPPLRERPGDIPLLVHGFVDQVCRELGSPTKVMAPEALTLLLAYPWPGNVRELENVVKHASILTAGPVITPEDLTPRVRGGAGRSEPGDTATLAEIDRRYIREVLQQEQWNISRAARVLGIHRATLYRKIMAYGLRPPDGSVDRLPEPGVS